MKPFARRYRPARKARSLSALAQGDISIERTIYGAWRVRGAIGTPNEEIDDPKLQTAPWANRDADAMLALQQKLARRLHTRWAKAERAVLDDQNSSAATTALLLVSKAFLLTVLEHIPPDRAQIAIDQIQKDFTIGLSSQRGMSDNIYFNKPYAGFWRVREPPLEDRRLPDYRANIDGNVDGPEGEID
jgi:hypothetical protein